MDQFPDKLHIVLNRIPRHYKSLFLFLLDIFLLPFCLYLAFALRLDTLTPSIDQGSFWLLILLHTVAGSIVLLTVRQDKVVLHNFDINSVFQIGLTTVLLFISFLFLVYLFRFWAPRSVPVIFSALFFIASAGIRVLLSILLNYVERRFNDGVPVAVYGTGSAAVQILATLHASSSHEPVCVFDDTSNLQGASILNVKVEKFENLERTVRNRNIRDIYIALPEASDVELKTITDRVRELDVGCHIAPTVNQLLLKHTRDALQNSISADDLLNREKFDFLSSELTTTYANKTIIITGAGGSIGSELCRQVLRFKPQKLVLFEISEFALYTITNELTSMTAEQDIAIVSKLGSVLDIHCLEAVLVQEGAQIFFHAAAYKHVPLVEENIFEAMQNNVLGTYNAATLAGQLSLEKFVLISTDKAVRPTNIMGATKRLAELVTNSCQEKYSVTAYSVVRFGNVLGSSGSVIPLFKKQIRGGGPVTVTHPDITRYFMTIPEASNLVLIAGFFSKGADTFVLDMGEPVKIVDLAKRMIELSGYSVKDDKTQEGEIGIDFIGLRSGEKMFEELIFRNSELVETLHDKIFRVREKCIAEIEAAKIVNDVSSSVKQRDEDIIMRIVTEYVEDFCRPSVPSTRN